MLTELSQCRLHIEEIYKTTRFNIQKDIWRLLHPKHFVNVLLIRHSEHSREKDILYVDTMMKHGLVLNKSGLLTNTNSDDTLLGQYLTAFTKPKESFKTIKTDAISNIFQPYKNNDGSTTIPKYILIESAPGMGKTTLCKEIAYQWSEHSLLKDTELLFLIYLHDPAIKRINQLKDLVHYQHNFDEEDTELSKQCAKFLNNRNGNGLTIVFDGYDEYNSSTDSIITKILDREVLPQCRILVTSRLTASNWLQRLADVRVEVLGFTDESKTQYIKQELQDHPDKIDELQSYLNTHATIKSICYMPMMMTILVYMFKEKGSLPNNSTELYDKFIALTMCHHLQKHNISADVFVTLQAFPIEHKSILTDLEKFAFLTLQNKQKVFSKEDIKNLCSNSLLASFNLENFGIINSLKYFCIDKGDSHVFSFLHLSIHEYLAAYYLSSIDQCEQFKELENTFLNEMYQETWNMFISMNKDTWLNVQNHFIYCKDTHRESLSHWIADINSESFVELYDILNSNTISKKVVQVLIYKSDQCSNNTTDTHKEQVYISLCDQKNVQQTKLELFVVNENLNSNWFMLFEHLNNRFSMVFYKDHILILSKSYQEQVVDFFKHQTSLTHIILIHCHITKNIADAIKLSYLQHILYLEISRCNIEDNALTTLTKFLSSITTLLGITVQGNKLSPELIKVVSSVIANNCNLKFLNLNNNHLQYKIHEVAKELPLVIKSNKQLEMFILDNSNLANKILNSLTTITTLTVLSLCNNQITQEADEALASVIMHNTALEELHLDGNSLGIGTLKVAKALQHITTLRILGLCNNKIPQEACDELALAIKSNKHLEILGLNDNSLLSSANIILNSLTAITTLTFLNLGNNQINQEADEALGSVIMHNTALEELHLDGNSLGVGTLKVAKSLQHITTLKKLGLGNNKIPQEACDELALAIKSNKHLKKLWLNDNNLHSSANVILNSLTIITTLTVLSLSNNQITQEADEALASVIMHNTGLEELHLDGNSLGVGTLKVAKALQHITTLKKLGLGNNKIPQEACDELALAIKSNKHLEILGLNDNSLLSSANIILNSLTAITTLTFLNLGNNQITQEADEALGSVIMHNTGLEELHLDGNSLGVGTLKVAKALQHITTLRILDLDNNKIPQEACDELALAIKSNKHLEILGLNDNSLLSSANIILNSLTAITTLTFLNLGNNQITQEADEALGSVIMHNTGLEELHLDGNSLGIGTLKVAKALQHITTLKKLGLGNNKIPQEACDELALAIKSNKHLKKLWLNDNNLHSSANVILNSLTIITTLTVLSLSKNQITEEAGEALASVIMHNTGLEELHLNGNSLGVGTLKVAKALQHITTLKKLGLGNNKIPQEACDELALAIKSNKHLKKLWLNDNNLHSSANVILNSLTIITTLTVLSLSKNQITEEAGEALASVIMHNTALEELHLDGNSLGIGTLKVAKALQHITTLRILGLCNNKIPQEACDELALAIKSNKHLEILGLNDNSLLSSANIILNSLTAITTLTFLNLGNNQINQEADEALGSVIMHNTALEELHLDGNSLGVGTLKVAKSLQHITTLKKLGLGNNKIPQEACDELALAIKSNKHLKKLWLNDNNLHSSANVILNSLTIITTLTVLSLSNNQITQEADEALASVIMHNTGLEELHLDGNSLGVGTLKVAKALQHITTLKKLGLGNNKIPQEACDELALAIKSNKHLEILGLNDNSLLSSANIILNSLTAITTLTFLNLGNNQITQEADEALGSVIMHNTGLEELHLDGNSLGVGTLKVAKALQHITTLRILDLDNNKIPQEACDELALAIKSNKHLEILGLNDNSLLSSANIILNSLTAITTLTFLNLGNNQITQEADEALGSVIMHNTGLEELHLDGNSLGIGTLKVAKALQHITTLKKLGLGNNKIPQEACDELALAIKSNKHLKKLWLNDNNLHSSANVILNSLTIITTLTVLSLSKNQITEEAGEALASVIMHNTGLEELHLNGNSLGVGTLKVAKALQHITTLKKLGLGNNKIPQEACDELALAIKSNKHLKKLWLNDNNLHSSANVILNSLTIITTLTVLSLSKNQITEEAGEALASVIMHNTGLEELHLNGNSLGVGTLKVAKALQHITTLKKLGLGNNKIPQEACDELALAIKSNKHLEILGLNDNSLLSSANIILNSLTAITTLTFLNLGNNQITQEADEALGSVIMHNTGLEELHLNGNSLGIGTLKVAKALQHITTLKKLGLGNNKIPQEACDELALAIKSNKHLKKLWLNDNNLHSSANVILNSLTIITTLTVLSLSKNQITEEAGEALASVIMHNTGLEELHLNGNSLGVGTLKVAKALQHITILKKLGLGNNKIPQEACDELALAIKSNKHLEILGLNDNSLLSSANIILNSLTAITTLTFLNLGNNQITQEADEALGSVIMHNTGLEELHLNGNSLGVGTLKVAKALQHITTLKKLGLGNNKIPQEACDELALAIKSNKHLEILGLNDNNLHSSANVILNSLTIITTLTVLSLSKNQITEEAGEALASVIMHNTGLEELHLDGNSLGVGTLKVAKALQHITTLKKLGLGNNKIPQEACDELALAIKSNKHLEILGLNDNSLLSSANLILNSLTAITTLTFLNLGNNQITQEADEALGSVIMHNTGLEELHLDGNSLGVGTLKVAKALQHITTLRILDLDNNKIPQEACDELALAIKSNKHLKKFWLNDNNLHSSANVILNSLTIITTLTVLSLSKNQITEEAGEALASVIMHNTGLEELHLDGNSLGVGTLKVAKALQHITTLKKLGLGNNKIPQEACDELALAIKSNKHLEILGLNDNSLLSSANIILNSLTAITTLTFLNLGNNQITQEADEALGSVIMHNTGLEELYLDGNSLGVGTLKVAKALQHITTLKKLGLGNNKIPQEACDELALAIKSNKHLEILGLNDNSLLSSANIILNSLTAITTLTFLNLGNNQITQEADEALGSVIMHNTGLEELHLDGNSLGVGTLKVAKALQHITTLRILDLDNNKIPQEACDELALAIKSNKHLKKLWLNDNNLHSSANVILNSLTIITTLTVLSLSKNQITEEAGEALASVIMHNTGLEELHLNGNSLGVGTLKVAKALQHITTLKKLGLGNNKIPQEACDELALAIKSNKHLEILGLNDNSLLSSANIILNSLTAITTLTFLNLGNNQITQEADEALGSVIMHNTGLEELHLNGNSLGIGTLKVAKALQHITTLKKLGLGNNKIPQEACDELALAIKSNKHLKKLWLNDNNLHSSANVILNSLTIITTLTVLSLSKNQITEEAGEALASVIMHNTGLEELHLDGNSLGVGTLKVAKALQHITTLKKLGLGNNKIPQEACDELALAIKSNKHLEILGLNDNSLLSSANIILNSLTAITTLTFLNLGNNQITQEADEALGSVIMHNTGLEELYLDGNSLGVGTLKVAKALQHITTLKKLGLGNNKIPQEACDELALAIKSNKHLEILGLNDNSLLSSANIILNSLTAITTLTFLNLGNNQITQETDEALASVIMHNTGLEELHLDGNSLGVGTLKVAKALQHITTLRILDLDNNKIPQEACDELALAIKSNKHLKKLWLNDNNLHSSANVILNSLTIITTLTVLSLSNNQITQEADEALGSVIMHNTGLEELHLNGNSLGVGTLKVAKALQHITTLKKLGLGNNKIPQEACDELALAIKSNKHLKKLWLNDNNLHSSANVILNSLTIITTLTVLSLSKNQITEEAGEALASVIMHNTGLEELHLDGNSLGVGTLKVAKALQHITTLKKLGLGNNKIPQEACDELALAIKSNKHLEILGLNDNSLLSSANIILNSLTAITTLTFLNLGNNQITPEADEALGSVIMHNTGLEELHLNGNSLGVGTLKVAKALQHITTLKKLGLGNNKIPQEACDELALAIKSNKHLEILGLNDNSLLSSANIILNSLTAITTLTFLNLGNNQITQEADEALGSVIMHNTGLEELYLDGNSLGVGTLKVAKALQHITTLKKLGLGNNKIPQEACDELALPIKSNKHLEILGLNDNSLLSSANIILNSLTAITTLTFLNLGNNQITQETDEALASVIMHNTGLEELHLDGNSLGVGTLKVAKALQHITTLRILDLDNNKIPQEACDELALAIKSNKHLKKLWLNDNNLHSSANVILNSLTIITTLTVLSLSNNQITQEADNQITQEADEALASVIMHNTGLEELYLDGNSLGVGTLKVAKALQHITTLRILDLDNNKIPQEACDELALAIKSNKHLKKLWLNDNNLHSSANVILNSLTIITTLTVLSLSNNQITQEADEALASVIMHNTGLEELHLDGNSLGVGTLKVAKALQHIITLKKLGLGNNKIPQEACDELALAIKSNKHLEILGLNDNSLLSSANIILNSLTAITTLTFLNLGNNQITQEADEALGSVIMHNTGLEELYLHGNSLGVGTLKVAKVLQHITTLKKLGLGNNKIPQEACDELALAIKSNKHLEILGLNDNSLLSSANIILNSLTAITTLTFLNLGNNQITQETDEALASVIMHNTGLEELHLDGNSLGVGTLKVAKALQHITTLRILGLGNNKIPQEACDELALAIKSNKHLEILGLNDNNLHSSANVILNSLTIITTLTVLSLSKNQITEEAGEALASVIMHNTGLEELHLNGNSLGVGTLKVAKALQHITTLKKLGLGNNKIPQEACDELALAIKSNKHLKKLLLNDNNLHSSANVILNSLTIITTLTVLSLSKNQITEEAGEALASVIMHNTGLEELHLNGNSLGVGTLKVAKALQHITTLKKLGLGNNKIPQEACDELALAIKSNKHLKKLLLNDNNLHSSANVILNSLTIITTLTVLSLSKNQITEEAGEALASVIMHNTGLEELHLNGNSLGVGTLKVAKALQHITTLKKLGLGNNKIPQEACDELALAIKSNKHLEILGLNDNSLLSSANIILNSLTAITTLTFLNLVNNQITQEADEALGSVIMHNTGLEELHLDGNSLGVGTLKVAKALQHITTLKKLGLGNNKIPQEACDELALAIKSNKHLEILGLNDNNLHSSANVILNS